MKPGTGQETRVILLNKPFGVLSQFTDRGNAGSKRRTLSELIDIPGVYPAGRLDQDSEGLMILTNDGQLQHRIANPANKMSKTYWAQVEGEPDEAALHRLREGVELSDGWTAPAKARALPAPEALWPRVPPIRFRKSVPDSWIELTITEGRNRQVRRMTAAVGYPTLRLIRVRIGDWELGSLQPGEWRDGEVPPPPKHRSRGRLSH
ncbi:MAG: pseudouridine synthase [Hyphomonas sp.]|nr:pseudouridine synthase [Hyphomonas sp.]